MGIILLLNKQGEIMKLSLLLTIIVSSGLLLSGCGAAEDAVNDAVNNSLDDSSASYTAVDKGNKAFDITFKVDNSGTSSYSYIIGSSKDTNSTTIDDVNYNIEYVVGTQYTDTSMLSSTKTNTLRCIPTNEEAFTCTDDVLYTTMSVDLKPKNATNGLNTLYLYKCKTSIDLNLVQSNPAYNSTCEKQATTITINGI